VTIETERLHLRTPTLEDAEAIFESYAQDPEVVRYLVWTAHSSVETTREFLRSLEAPIKSGASHPFTISLMDGPLVGMIELRIKPEKDRAEVGYVLARDYWGKGIVTEALRAVILYGFSMAGIDRITAICDIDNIGSARVMEKAGMSFEGIQSRTIVHPNISSEPRDVRCYAVTR
jgi:[ribosomal protein S5]-alanine N-acetyltransferase